jgi:hypothetical protein
MKDIEELLEKNKVSVTKLTWPSLKLPPDILSIVQTGGYGENASGGSSLDPAVKAKMESIKRSVKELEITENTLQNSYWKLRNKFRTMQSKE